MGLRDRSPVSPGFDTERAQTASKALRGRPRQRLDMSAIALDAFSTAFLSQKYATGRGHAPCTRGVHVWRLALGRPQGEPPRLEEMR